MIFHNHPVYIPIKNYHEERERYVERIAKQETVTNIYGIGGFGAPGISDIDLIVVIEPTGNKVPNLSPSALNMDRSLFLHGPFFVNSSTFSDFHELLIIKNFDNLYRASTSDRREREVKPPTDELRLMQAIDLNRMRLNQLIRDKNRGKADKRVLLTRLSSIVHSASLCEAIGVDLPRTVHEFKATIENLRCSWVEEYGSVEIDYMLLFDQAIDAFCQILDSIANSVSGQLISINHRRESRHKMIGIQYANGNECVIEEGRNGCFRLKIPRAFMGHYEGYLNAAHATENMSKYGCAQRKRYRCVLAHDRFLERHGLIYSMRGNIGVPTTLRQKRNLVLLSLQKQLMYALALGCREK